MIIMKWEDGNVLVAEGKIGTETIGAAGMTAKGAAEELKTRMLLIIQSKEYDFKFKDPTPGKPVIMTAIVFGAHLTITAPNVYEGLALLSTDMEAYLEVVFEKYFRAIAA